MLSRTSLTITQAASINHYKYYQRSNLTSVASTLPAIVTISRRKDSKITLSFDCTFDKQWSCDTWRYLATFGVKYWRSQLIKGWHRRNWVTQQQTNQTRSIWVQNSLRSCHEQRGLWEHFQIEACRGKHNQIRSWYYVFQPKAVALGEFRPHQSMGLRGGHTWTYLPI